MTIFKTIFGIIVSLLGLGMAVAGWAVAAHGQWIPAINLYFGLVIGLMGIGSMWLGFKLIFDTTIKDALFRLAESRAVPQGCKVYIYWLARIMGILPKVLLYTLLAIAILLISIMSVTRYTHLPLNLDALPK
jgi:hypothetical protein